MSTRVSTAWVQGLLAILFFVLVGELSVQFNEYVFHRLGINRTAFMSVLWALPVAAAFIAARYSKQNKLLAGMSYAILLPLLGSLAHFVSGELGGPVDFAGVRGAVVTFKIYLVLAVLTTGLGTALGVAFSPTEATGA